ncbi:helix-turn-helix domain-containing protein [Tardiphaga sp. 367_B4_N1_1]|uniref:helix-turn-helix domain-containing protein n=1 Tax=Tardiphaga sp. 367_B4_N1_1 TaxID=3240777 RepID=UPI003F27E5A3
MPTPPNNIASIRKRLRMTQQQLADALGVHWITVSKIERGKMRLTTEWMTKIAKVLGVGPAALLTGKALTEVPLTKEISFGRTLSEYNGDHAVYPIEAGDLDRENSEWARLSGDKWAPFYCHNDLLKLTEIPEAQYGWLTNRIATVRLAEDGREILAILDEYIGNSTFSVRHPDGTSMRRAVVSQVRLVTAHIIALPKDPNRAIGDTADAYGSI